MAAQISDAEFEDVMKNPLLALIDDTEAAELKKQLTLVQQLRFSTARRAAIAVAPDDAKVTDIRPPPANPLSGSSALVAGTSHTPPAGMGQIPDPIRTAVKDTALTIFNQSALNNRYTAVSLSDRRIDVLARINDLGLGYACSPGCELTPSGNGPVLKILDTAAIWAEASTFLPPCRDSLLIDGLLSDAANEGSSSTYKGSSYSAGLKIPVVLSVDAQRSTGDAATSLRKGTCQLANAKQMAPYLDVNWSAWSLNKLIEAGAIEINPGFLDQLSKALSKKHLDDIFTAWGGSELLSHVTLGSMRHLVHKLTVTRDESQKDRSDEWKSAARGAFKGIGASASAVNLSQDAGQAFK